VSAPDLVEAAVRSGRPEAARASYENFHAWELATGGCWTRMLGERMRALLTDGPDVERHLVESLEMARTHFPFDAARARLALGEWLRRTRRRADARTHLRAALATFEALGARPWAERAHGELRATGETARDAAPSRLQELTPQELQIAGFVADGATNREIAAKLFISVRTVEHHLRKAFAKLGVSSRHDLARLVAEDEAGAGEAGPAASVRSAV
jgi:DNA-binding CsgD family transcriptional regulator